MTHAQRASNQFIRSERASKVRMHPMQARRVLVGVQLLLEHIAVRNEGIPYVGWLRTRLVLVLAGENPNGMQPLASVRIAAVATREARDRAKIGGLAREVHGEADELAVDCAADRIRYSLRGTTFARYEVSIDAAVRLHVDRQ